MSRRRSRGASIALVPAKGVYLHRTYPDAEFVVVPYLLPPPTLVEDGAAAITTTWQRDGHDARGP